MTLNKDMTKRFVDIKISLLDIDILASCELADVSNLNMKNKHEELIIYHPPPE